MRPDSTAGPERSHDDPNAGEGPPEAELDLAAAGEEPSPAAVVLTRRDPT